MRVKIVNILLAVAFLAASSIAEEAADCNATACALPSCRCSSTDTPGGLSLEETPMFVVLSFDNAVTIENYPLYQRIHESTNPNSCPFKMTFFVSHVSTDYTLVNKLYLQGHDIAVNSVTNKPASTEYWRELDTQGWIDEIKGQKDMLVQYGQIDADDIKGFRAPYLEVGGNEMYGALKEAGFEYDCSWPSLSYTPWSIHPPNNEIYGALWPYTLDYMSVQDETVGTKPSDSFPGLWVSPMTDLQDLRGVECAMLDACQSEEETDFDESPDAVFELLSRNFKSHYVNRTPFGIYVRNSWFQLSSARGEGFEMFMDYLKAYSNVFVVSEKQLLAWVKNPTPVDDITDLDEFKCQNTEDNVNCKEVDNKNCMYNETLPISESFVYMKICQGACPPYYPYLNNIDGDIPYTTN